MLCHLQYCFQINLPADQWLFTSFVAVAFYFIVLYIPFFKIVLTERYCSTQILKIDEAIQMLDAKHIRIKHL